MKNFLIILSLVFSFNVHAGLLKIELSSENVQLGDTVELKIIATGFDNFDTFNFSLGFDNTIFDYSASSFMSDLLNSNPERSPQISQFFDDISSTQYMKPLYCLKKLFYC